MNDDLIALFADKARAGDGQFAIAFALLTLAAEHRALQQNLTFGDGSADRAPGVLEHIATSLREISETMRDRDA